MLDVDIIYLQCRGRKYATICYLFSKQDGLKYSKLNSSICIIGNYDIQRLRYLFIQNVFAGTSIETCNKVVVPAFK